MARTPATLVCEISGHCRTRRADRQGYQTTSAVGEDVAAGVDGDRLRCPGGRVAHLTGKPDGTHDGPRRCIDNHDVLAVGNVDTAAVRAYGDGSRPSGTGQPGGNTDHDGVANHPPGGEVDHRHGGVFGVGDVRPLTV